MTTNSQFTQTLRHARRLTHRRVHPCRALTTWLVIGCCTGLCLAQQSRTAVPVDGSEVDHSVTQQGTEQDVQATEGQPASFWMDQKLRLSKDILEGLANADFEAIGKNAEVMRGLNRVEAFVRRGPEGYREQLAQFNMANRSLISAARRENLDGATLAFNQLTISCVRCHQHLRIAD